MAILKVAKLGNPVLRDVAKPVPVSDITGPDLQRLIENMVETMREYDGLGLAAPQVHESIQILVVEEMEHPADPRAKAAPLTVLVNPKITVVSEALDEDWEGCLSIPDLRGLVPRYEAIHVQGHDAKGKAVDFRAQGIFARVLQHEHDHLIGKVFLDRMRSFESLTFLKEFSRYWRQEETGD